MFIETSPQPIYHSRAPRGEPKRAFQIIPSRIHHHSSDTLKLTAKKSELRDCPAAALS